MAPAESSMPEHAMAASVFRSIVKFLSGNLRVCPALLVVVYQSDF